LIQRDDNSDYYLFALAAANACNIAAKRWAGIVGGSAVCVVADAAAGAFEVA
jgi:hypothetical protein